MKEFGSGSENKYFLSFLSILTILIFLVVYITVISAEIPDDTSSDLLAVTEQTQYADNETLDDKGENNADESTVMKKNTIVFPLDGNITSLFAYRIDPFYDPASGEEPTYEYHRGIDISAAKSRDIMACADGTVTFTGYDASYGNYIMIEHENFVSLYAHCESILCSVGDVTEAGESIAVAGSTGRSTGPHLHFEIRVDGVLADPLDYVGCVFTGKVY